MHAARSGNPGGNRLEEEGPKGRLATVTYRCNSLQYPLSKGFVFLTGVKVIGEYDYINFVFVRSAEGSSTRWDRIEGATLRFIA